MNTQRIFTSSIVPKGKQNHGTCTIYIVYVFNKSSFLLSEICLWGKLYWNYIHCPCKLSLLTEVENLNGSCFRQLTFKEKFGWPCYFNNWQSQLLTDSCSLLVPIKYFNVCLYSLNKFQLSLEKKLMTFLKVLKSLVIGKNW